MEQFATSQQTMPKVSTKPSSTLSLKPRRKFWLEHPKAPASKVKLTKPCFFNISPEQAKLLTSESLFQWTIIQLRSGLT
jgi:hypothetical protein